MSVWCAMRSVLCIFNFICSAKWFSWFSIRYESLQHTGWWGCAATKASVNLWRSISQPAMCPPGVRAAPTAPLWPQPKQTRLPSNTKRSHKVVLMLAHRRRRWANIQPNLGGLGSRVQALRVSNERRWCSWSLFLIHGCYRWLWPSPG